MVALAVFYFRRVVRSINQLATTSDVLSFISSVSPSFSALPYSITPQRDFVGTSEFGPQWEDDEEVDIYDKEGQETVEISLVFEREPAR